MGEDKEEFKLSDNDSEDLQSGCESDDSSGAKRKKYPNFQVTEGYTQLQIGGRIVFYFKKMILRKE